MSFSLLGALLPAQGLLRASRRCYPAAGRDGAVAVREWSVVLVQVHHAFDQCILWIF